MEALDLLRGQAANADDVLGRVFTPVTPEQATWQLSGSTANTIALTYLHTYFTEDEQVQRLLGKPALLETGGWKERFGYDPQGWTLAKAPATSQLMEYGAAVTAATRDYLAAATPADVERQIETRQGLRPLIARLSVYLVNHKFQHTGEIAALLGCQGVKGLPF